MGLCCLHLGLILGQWFISFPTKNSCKGKSWKMVSSVVGVMANSISLIPPCSSMKIPDQTGSFSSTAGIGNSSGFNQLVKSSRTMRFKSLEVKATTGSDKDGKVRSILCSDCDGNGAVGCSQCKGTGVNSIDHFNGRFKAGSECWLCSGRKEMLCGNCNGAGFLGGFMSTKDE